MTGVLIIEPSSKFVQLRSNIIQSFLKCRLISS